MRPFLCPMDLTMRFAKNIDSALRPLIEFVYPGTCLLCNVHLDDYRQWICPECWASARIVPDDDPLYQEMRVRLGSGGHIADLVTCFSFERGGTFQKIIHQIKYKGMRRLGNEVGKRLGERIGARGLVREIDGAVFVPLHSTRKRERGYNQSECIARGLCDMTGIQLLPLLLERRRYTETQTHLNAQERKENVRQAITVNPKSKSIIQGKTLLVVDDIITTGSTIESCAEALLNAGAKRIIAASAGLATHVA
jgi:ComF family protein